MKRPVIALGLVMLLVVALGSGAIATSNNDKVEPLNRDPSDPAVVRDAMGQGARVVTARGKAAGYKCGGAVVLPAGVTATPACALNGSGKVVGYMTFGDVGFVDRKTGRDREALATLVRCYDEVVEYSISGSVPFTKECRASLKVQGVDVSKFTRGSPEKAQQLADHQACVEQTMTSGRGLVDVDAACPWPPPK